MKKYILILLAFSLSFAGSSQDTIKHVIRGEISIGGTSAMPGFTPEAYGAKGDGVTNDAPAFQAMINAMPSRGGRVWLSNKSYFLASGLTINKPIYFQGEGSADALFLSAATEIITSSGTARIMNVLAPGVTFRDISFKCTASTVSLGSEAIAADNSTSDYNNNANSIGIYNCSFRGFFIDVHILNCSEYWIKDNKFYGAGGDLLRIENILLPDGGDADISGNQFIAMDRNCYAAIHQLAGGGAKIQRNKFNSRNNFRFDYAYDGFIGGNTVDLLIQGNSGENFAKAFSRVRRNGNDFFYNVLISDNQIAPYLNTGAPWIDLDRIDAVICTDNMLTNIPGGTDRGVSITNGQDIKIGNNYRNFTNKTPILTGSVRVINHEGAIDTTTVTPVVTGPYVNATFTAADGTLLTAYTPEVGGSFTVPQGPFTIQSGQAVGNGAADPTSQNQSRALINATNKDYKITMYATKSSVDNMQILLRYVDGQNLLAVNVSQTASFLYSVVADALTTTASGSSGVNDTNEHLYEVFISGSNVTLKIDNAQIFSSTTPLNAALSSGTIAGFTVKAAGKVSSFRIDPYTP